MGETFELLGLLSLFHLIGGAAAGASLRRGIRQGWSWSVFATLSKGLLWGGLPLYYGASEFARREVSHLVWIEVLVLAGAILAASLMPDWIPELFNDQDSFSILIGGAFMVVGFIVFVILAGDDVLEAFCAFAALGGVGGFVLVTGALKVLRDRAL